MNTNITGKVAILSTIIGAMLGASIIGCLQEQTTVIVAEYPAEDAGVEAGNEGGCLNDAIESQDDNVNGYCCNDSAAKPGEEWCKKPWRLRCNLTAVLSGEEVYMPGGVQCFMDEWTWICCEL